MTPSEREIFVLVKMARQILRDPNVVTAAALCMALGPFIEIEGDDYCPDSFEVDKPWKYADLKQTTGLTREVLGIEQTEGNA